MIVGEEKCDPPARRPLPRREEGVAAARLGCCRLLWLRFSSRRWESSRKDFEGECVFSCLEGDGCFKMVCGSRRSLFFPIFISTGGIALKGVCINYLGPVTE